jgi:hypothetical protein
MVNVPYPRYTTEADAVIDIANSLRRISEIIGWNTATTGVIDSQPTAFREVAFRIAEYLAALEEGVAEPPAAVGPPGETNEITIGVVDTLAPGSPATASLTGVSPAQVLNLGIPAGANGIDGINGEDGEDGAGGGGDMFKVTYDPTNVNGNAFDMEKMVEGATKKILTPAERTKIGTIPGTGFATVAETGMATDVQTENLSGYWIGGTVEHALENIGDVLYGGTAGPVALAPLASPALTGNPTAPTPATSDNDTSIATTAYVKTNLANALASPAFTGNPTAPTPSTSDNDTSIATTAYVQANLANVIAKGLVDAKGDLIVATADNTPARLAVGTNGFVLTADSAEATGLKWAAAAGGGGSMDGIIPKVGQYLIPAIIGTSWSTSTDALPFGTAAAATPIINPKEFTADALTCNVVTLEAVAVRVLLYSSDADGHPATLVATATGTPSGTGGLLVTLASAVVLPAGVYWAIVRSDGGSTLRFSAGGGGLINSLMSTVSTSVGTPSRNTLPALTVGGTFASPNTTPTVTSISAVTANDAPYVGIRRSA